MDQDCELRRRSVRARRKPPQRRTLNCLPCRSLKLKCNRRAPCESCIRHGREDACLRNPPPQAQSSQPGALSNVLTLETVLPAPSPTQTPLPRGVDWPIHRIEAPIIRAQQLQPQQRPAVTTPSPFLPMAKARIASRTAADTIELLEQLAQQLPMQSQCDILLSFYELHMNWVYSVIDMPNFRKQYNAFWLTRADVDLAWVALLYAILCVSVIYAPPEILQILEFGRTAVELADKWYFASRQCLFAANCESRPSLTQLQSFIITQLYWHATNDPETLYS